ncbi:hypothetical protein AB0L57_08690 [Nocardia sp. NPDC052254]|uniref:hypothetical protein n=1 Tax=Nocardia sp. NPDC052254 TaxID=3155681 RepID=UPI0034393BA3
MFAGIAAVLIVVVVLAAAYRYAAGPGRRVVDRFDRYPPHAPMSDWPVLNRPMNGPMDRASRPHTISRPRGPSPASR